MVEITVKLDPVCARAEYKTFVCGNEDCTNIIGFYNVLTLVTGTLCPRCLKPVPPVHLLVNQIESRKDHFFGIGSYAKNDNI